MEVFWKIRRRDEAHVVCDDAETWSMYWLMPQVGVQATRGYVLLGVAGAMWLQAVAISIARRPDYAFMLYS